MKKTQAKSGIHAGELASYYFHQGTSMRAYEYLGVHREQDSIVFRVWAPNADFVSVVGDFNCWNAGEAPMRRVTERGVWEVVLDGDRVRDGQTYKYFIRRDGREFEKADPYGVRMEHPPKTASVVWGTEGYKWRDAGWMRYRKTRFTREKLMEQPINIYEVHAGSWKRHGDGRPFTYVELATELVTYVQQMGYTHVELMPPAEHPFEGSWGYQVSGYYAPSSRHGTPQDLMRLVDILHEAGIGVIFDWVPAHFPKDPHGLYEFDGAPLYEYQGQDRREHPTWGTHCFDVGREEVQSFLISNAAYWADRFHVDGLRVDAVSAMLYLDFDRNAGDWTPNCYGENKNLEAVAFFQKLNGSMAREYPDVMMIAEESTSWPHVTSFDAGGLGFSLKWNMGWMNDTLSYLKEDPLFRRHHHNKMNFSISYAFGENYVLPISHDEVTHGKRSLLDRSPGDYWQKFAGTRAYMTYLMTHPGKKLLFMGSEIGQFSEWRHDACVEWFLLDYEKHAQMQLFQAELNRLYLANPALWERDGSWEGFRWIDPDNAEQSIYSYRRIDAKGGELIVLLNFTPMGYSDFLLAVPQSGAYEEIFNSDESRFGGTGVTNDGRLESEACEIAEHRNAIRVSVPPFGGLILRPIEATKRKASKTI